MSDIQPDLDGGDRDEPPFDLTREMYGYIVLSAGIATGFVALFYFPESVPYWRLTRLVPLFGIAVATHFVYQYVTTTWYDQFEDTQPEQ